MVIYIHFTKGMLQAKQASSVFLTYGKVLYDF